MDAFRDRGTVRQTLTEGVDDARHVLAEAERLGLRLDDVTARLVTNGVALFSDAADALLGAVAGKRAAILGARLNGLEPTLPKALTDAVDARLEMARAQGWSRRLVRGDTAL